MLSPELVEVLNKVDKLETASGESEETRVDPDPIELSKSLYKSLLELKAQFLSEDGTSTNYSGFRESSSYANFQLDCRKLCHVDLSKLNNDDKRKAFFLNIYNVLTMHALANKVTSEKTVLELEKFWQMYGYRIGTHIFSLDDIEHGILRCNKLHPTHKDYFFKQGDPRRELVLPELDPRIHFALNCGAKSCPPIRLFSPDNLHNGLELAAKSFCQGEVIINEQEKCVTLSKIFLWYGSDFACDEKSIVYKVTEWLSPEQKRQVENLSADFSVKFADYDWAIH
ncbi:hypothetical protein Ocin01_10733 [Orchesella cincta]|uniref:DUF547 domain-containing protein n=1 Tax=Orchesella cincta TaxID=48709 RepID=A0A1D2MT30_ORCCI|nr:hypothetical protein Ocin01_10733 [Orchesella cincta]